MKWKYSTDTPMVAAVTPAASGIVLTGDTEGGFLALYGASGKVVLKKGPDRRRVVTYTLDGTQYVAVAGGMNNPILQTKSGPAWVAIFALAQRNE